MYTPTNTATSTVHYHYGWMVLIYKIPRKVGRQLVVAPSFGLFSPPMTTATVATTTASVATLTRPTTYGKTHGNRLVSCFIKLKIPKLATIVRPGIHDKAYRVPRIWSGGRSRVFHVGAHGLNFSMAMLRCALGEDIFHTLANKK